MERKTWNFAAGPAMIPEAVLKRAQHEFLDFQGTGVSVMELSHRSKTFEAVVNRAKEELRGLLGIPDTHEILFMQGGGTTQFAAVVYNMLSAKRRQMSEVPEGWNPPVDYMVTGSWSQKAMEEAKRLGANVNVVFNTKASTGSYTSIPPRSEWKLSGPDAAYVYYCANETIHGVEFPAEAPDVSAPLVCDMSSNILSRSFDVSKYALIYAGAQKNIGPAGLTIVIVRRDLLAGAHSAADKLGVPVPPLMLDYKVAADNNSLYNTPPMFSIYMAGLVFEWLREQGGVKAMEERNERKARLLYETIDKSSIYKCPVDSKARSRMNVCFRIGNEELEKAFVQGAAARGMIELKGHRSVGGIRVSAYNAMPEEGVQKLVEYMREFERVNGKA
ncbi:uncharacterized protein VTP21DRAFT_459 [Calcarisporiella thermophila]|uniref:uncharacterized protein n=1 Tax=Calcarisporiella thermophila TaxID=911321 RepID=UPI0037438973